MMDSLRDGSSMSSPRELQRGLTSFHDPVKPQGYRCETSSLRVNASRIALPMESASR
jgi:hypothetical protein